MPPKRKAPVVGVSQTIAVIDETHTFAPGELEATFTLPKPGDSNPGQLVPGEDDVTSEPDASPDPMPAAIPAPPPAVSVVVPWRPSPDRVAVWAWLRARWAATHPDWELVEGTCPDGPWRKGVAVADGVARAQGEVLVIADADVWTDGVDEAVRLVTAGAVGWATPHHLLRRLSALATEQVLESGGWPTVRTSFTYAERPYPAHPGGGVVVTTKAGYAQAPIDPRFAGWGQEDDAWAVALRLLLGREWRGTADLWHLWHTAQPRQSRSMGSTASAALHRRYLGAKSSPRAMAGLIAESHPVAVG